MVQRATRAVEPLPLMVLRAGQAAVHQGHPCSGFWLVEAGLLRAWHVTDDGRELWLDVLGPGDVVGDDPEVEAAWGVTALEPARLTAVGGGERGDALARRASRLAALATTLAWLDVPDRIEHRLRDLAHRFGSPVPGGIALPIALRQDDVAALVGASRESATRAIAALIGRGTIARPRRGLYVVRPPLRSLP